MRGSKGYYTGARGLLKKKPRERGKPKLGKLLIEYETGSQEKRGRGYVVSVSKGDAVKKIIVRSEHLEPYKGSS
jgi:ribosomal protein L21E